MSEFKGTPGPWHIEQFDGEDTIYVYVSPKIDPDNMGICALLPVDLTTSDRNPWVHGRISKANGHLIVAAPDLFDALETLERLSGSGMASNDPARVAARAALAKALGQ